MPLEGVAKLAHEDILTYEEILRVVEEAVKLGIRRLRVTGGEPLVRAGIVDFIERLARLDGVDDLSLTTNAVLLADFAKGLARAGLRRVNVSLDTLRPNKYAEITGSDSLDKVLLGIQAAKEAGLNPVKINNVVIREVNDDEILDFARRTVDEGWHVRFIELMPVSFNQRWTEKRLVTQTEIVTVLEDLGPLIPVNRELGAGPAKYYRYEGAPGTIGFITHMSGHFCSQCNRLRLTADGKLRSCLFSDDEIDVRSTLRSGIGNDGIEPLIRLAVKQKPQRGKDVCDPERGRGRTMRGIGG